MSIHLIAKGVDDGWAPFEQGYEWVSTDESKVLRIASKLVQVLREHGYRRKSYLDKDGVMFVREPNDCIHVTILHGKVLRIVEINVQLASQNVII